MSEYAALGGRFESAFPLLSFCLVDEDAGADTGSETPANTDQPPGTRDSHCSDFHCTVTRRDLPHTVDWNGLRNLDHQVQHSCPAHTASPGIYRYEQGWLYRASWQQMVAEVVVAHDGTSMSWFVDGGPDAHDISSLLTGAMASAAATAAGAQVFHGALLSVHGLNLAILGDTGAGKSTTTWALINAGASLLSDDAFRLVESRGELRACTAGRMLRLDDPALLAWGLDPDELPRVHLADPRRLLTTQLSRAAVRNDSATLAGVPLDGVLILRRGPEALARHTISALSPAGVFRQLPKNMHPVWMHQKPTADAFRAQASLAEQVPAWELTVPGSLSALRADAGAMFERLGGLAAGRDERGPRP